MFIFTELPETQKETAKQAARPPPCPLHATVLGAGSISVINRWGSLGFCWGGKLVQMSPPCE